MRFRRVLDRPDFAVLMGKAPSEGTRRSSAQTDVWFGLHGMARGVKVGRLQRSRAMAWDFETDPEFQKKLDWIEDFMAEEVEPVSYLGMAIYGSAGREEFIKPLQQQVRDQGLWACHLGPELGGQGFGQLKLALINEKLGRNSLAPTVFGCQAPDTGNAEIIAHYGTPAQKEKWLKPLLNGDIRSAFSMSEPASH